MKVPLFHRQEIHRSGSEEIQRKKGTIVGSWNLRKEVSFPQKRSSNRKTVVQRRPSLTHSFNTTINSAIRPNPINSLIRRWHIPNITGTQTVVQTQGLTYKNTKRRDVRRRSEDKKWTRSTWGRQGRFKKAVNPRKERKTAPTTGHDDSFHPKNASDQPI